MLVFTDLKQSVCMIILKEIQENIMDYKIEITQVKKGTVLLNACNMVSKGWYCAIYYHNEERHFTRDKLSLITRQLNYWNREGFLEN